MDKLNEDLRVFGNGFVCVDPIERTIRRLSAEEAMLLHDGTVTINLPPSVGKSDLSLSHMMSATLKQWEDDRHLYEVELHEETMREQIMARAARNTLPNWKKRREDGFQPISRGPTSPGDDVRARARSKRKKKKAR